MILVTGGCGVMGSRLVRGLVEKGWQVRALTLPNDPYVTRLADVDCEIFYGDVADARTLKRAFDGVHTVYHLAAIIITQNPDDFEKINVQGTRNVLAGAAQAGVRHFIDVSSVSVVYPRTTPYSQSKRICEKLVKEQTSMDYTIVRPSLAYEDKGGQEFMMFMEYLQKYPVVPFIGRGQARKNPVRVEDLIQGFIAIAGNERSYGKTYNFTGGEVVSIRELAQLMMKYNGMKKPLIPIPLWLCHGLARLMALTMKNPPLTWNVIAGITQDADLDHNTATRDLNYRPIGIRDGLAKLSVS